ncbi:MAG: hypothetical protein WC989_03265 [Micavibrio sp.]
MFSYQTRLSVASGANPDREALRIQFSAPCKGKIDPDKDPEQLLIEAFVKNDYPAFKRVIDMPCAQHALDRMVLYAASYGREEYAMALLDRGASGQSYMDGCLNFFCMKGDIEAAGDFYGRGCDIHNNRDQPLRSAIYGMQESTFRFAIDRGCCLKNALDDDTVETMKALPPGFISQLQAFVSRQGAAVLPLKLFAEFPVQKL